MKLFKIIDYYVQACLIASVVAIDLFLWAVNDMNGQILILGYLIVGGWQVCSVIVNFMIPSAYKVRRRKIYLVLLLLTIIACAVIWFSMRKDDAILFAGVLLLAWSPILAILYLITCYHEMVLVKQPAVTE